MADAFIKLHRKLLDWEWYDDANTMRLFIHCLLRANWKAGSWHGITYGPGQFITSLASLSDETGLSIQQVRTSLSHLISTGEITSNQQAKCRIITVNNWDMYQGDNRQSNKKSTRCQQDDNKVLTTDKEYKEYKNIKEFKRGFVPPSLEEVKAYAAQRGNKVDAQKFFDYYTEGEWKDSKGDPVKSWKQKMITWENKGPQKKTGVVPANTRSYDYAALEAEVMK